MITDSTPEKDVVSMKKAKAVKSISKNEFLKNAKKRGAVVYKNNIHKAKPLSDVSGHVTADKEYSPEELLCR